ncbi:PAAR domain-containing protein [Aliamphritea spongicola]|nr:PAAR domain-containing protein [Aliamphritea spongicola]
MGDSCVCVGPPDSIVKGSATVMVGGKPAARMGIPPPTEAPLCWVARP